MSSTACSTYVACRYSEAWLCCHGAQVVISIDRFHCTYNCNAPCMLLQCCSVHIMLLFCWLYLQLYKKTPAAICSLESSQTPSPDIGGLVASLLDQQSEIAAHNKMGLSCVVSDSEVADSNRYLQGGQCMYGRVYSKGLDKVVLD